MRRGAELRTRVVRQRGEKAHGFAPSGFDISERGKLHGQRLPEDMVTRGASRVALGPFFFRLPFPLGLWWWWWWWLWKLGEGIGREHGVLGRGATRPILKPFTDQELQSKRPFFLVVVL